MKRLNDEMAHSLAAMERYLRGLEMRGGLAVATQAERRTSHHRWAQK